MMLTNLSTFYGPPRGINPKEVSADSFITGCSRHLKNSAKFELPKWEAYVKTASSRELAPYDPDWMYIRAASLLRKLFICPDVGVLGLRKKYSKLHRRGTKPGHRAIAGGKVIRHCLRQLEKMGYVEQQKRKGWGGGSNSGRRLSPEGYKLAHQLSREAKESSTPKIVTPAA